MSRRITTGLLFSKRLKSFAADGAVATVYFSDKTVFPILRFAGLSSTRMTSFFSVSMVALCKVYFTVDEGAREWGREIMEGMDLYQISVRLLQNNFCYYIIICKDDVCINFHYSRLMEIV